MEAQRGVALVVLSKIQGKLMIDFLPFLGPDGQLHIGFPPSDAIERNLVAWLESHKFSGGRAALTGDITVNEFCTFVPYPNMPPLSVETEKHTIFVCADTELLSDGRLTFEGEGGGQGIFHVERDGTLLDGVNVKAVSADGGSQYALWQEEGAGMILGNTFAPCRVSGDIHYARTPLVLDAEHVCVVVEKGGSFWMTVCHGSHMQGERAGSHSGA